MIIYVDGEPARVVMPKNWMRGREVGWRRSKLVNKEAGLRLAQKMGDTGKADELVIDMARIEREIAALGPEPGVVE